MVNNSYKRPHCIYSFSTFHVRSTDKIRRQWGLSTGFTNQVIWTFAGWSDILKHAVLIVSAIDNEYDGDRQRLGGSKQPTAM
jgi:hypothetical protein